MNWSQSTVFWIRSLRIHQVSMSIQPNAKRSFTGSHWPYYGFQGHDDDADERHGVDSSDAKGLRLSDLGSIASLKFDLQLYRLLITQAALLVACRQPITFPPAENGPYFRTFPRLFFSAVSKPIFGFWLRKHLISAFVVSSSALLCISILICFPNVCHQRVVINIQKYL